MANPVITSCALNAWTKVATNVTTGMIHKLSNSPKMYLQTYRLTGNPAPTLQSEGVLLFVDKLVESIESTAGIDVYIWTVGAIGSVRVDV